MHSENGESNKMKYKSKILALTLALFASQSAAHAEREVAIEDISQGCFGGLREETVFNKQNDKYVSKKGISFTKNDLKDLIEIIQASKSVSEFDPASMGITPESVKQHYNDMLNASLNLKDPVYKKIKPEIVAAFDYKPVCEAAKKRLTAKDNSTNHIIFTATINDPELSKEKIVVKSTHDVGYLLPWKVTVGDNRWQTYSIALSEKLVQFADKKGPCALRLDGKKDWQSTFWHDGMFWQHQVGFELHRNHAEKYAKLIPGFAEADKIFVIEDIYSGLINFQPESLFMELEARQPQTIEYARWWNHYKNDQPAATWTQFIEKFRTAEKLAQKQAWLMSWKKANQANKLQVSISGANSYEETSIKEMVMPAWKNANMKGVPEVAIILMRGKDTFGKLYISSLEPRALLVEATPVVGPGKSLHWLDRLSIYFHPARPSYVVVQANGKFEKQSIAKGSKLLPKTFPGIEGL